jgi:hypothetical protein
VRRKPVDYSSAPEEVAEKSLSETAVTSEVRDSAEKENIKPTQIANSKVGIDDELEKLISKLQELGIPEV